MRLRLILLIIVCLVCNTTWSQTNAVLAEPFKAVQTIKSNPLDNDIKDMLIELYHSMTETSETNKYARMIPDAINWAIRNNKILVRMPEFLDGASCTPQELRAILGASWGTNAVPADCLNTDPFRFKDATVLKVSICVEGLWQQPATGRMIAGGSFAFRYAYLNGFGGAFEVHREQGKWRTRVLRSTFVE